MKPFSDNIIFWDTEFTSLDPYKGELLSLAFVKPSGEELYIELDHTGEVDAWVKENILPTLTQPKTPRTEAMAKINEFIGTDRPFLVAFVNQFDTVYFYKLLNNKDNTKNYPFHWIFIDFASMLFAQGMDPETFSGKNKEKLLTDFGIDMTKYQKHNALDDARMLKDVYQKLIKQ